MESHDVVLDVCALVACVENYPSLAAAQRGQQQNPNPTWLLLERAARRELPVRIHGTDQIWLQVASVLVRRGWSRRDANNWARRCCGAAERSGGNAHVAAETTAAFMGRCFRAGVEGKHDDPVVLAATVAAGASLVTWDRRFRDGAENMGVAAYSPTDYTRTLARQQYAAAA